MSLFAELKRRNVLRVAGLYVAGAWLVLQVAGTVLPMIDAPIWLSRAVVVVLAIGFLPALVFAWAFEITSEGLKREHEVDREVSITPQTGRRLDRVIMAVLALALVYFAVDKFLLAPERTAAQTEAARSEGRSTALTESYGDRSIAVLPFVDRSPGQDQAYLADGLAEELLNQLAKIPELRVISRTSAFSFRDDDLAVPEIARRLNVAHVLEGSVRPAAGAVRVTAQLVDARSDTQLWSATYDRPLEHIFAVQDEIAAAVVEKLKLEAFDAPSRARPVDPRAHALVLQARHVYLQGSAEGMQRAIELYQQALAIEPGDAAAWAGLATVYSRQAAKGLRPVDEGYGLAREAANKALAIDPGRAPAHVTLGWIADSYDVDPAGAARHFGRALALAPTDVEIVRDAAPMVATLGRFDQAIALGEYATSRDPVNPLGHHYLAYAYYVAGRYEQAIASWNTVLRLAPDFGSAHQLIGLALVASGDPAAALTEIRQEPVDEWRRAGLPVAWHALGKPAESDAALAELIREQGNDWAYNIAAAFAYRGEADRAFEWLEKAVVRRDSGLPEVALDPLFRNLREDPRWLPFLRRIGKAPEQLAAIRLEVQMPAK